MEKIKMPIFHGLTEAELEEMQELRCVRSALFEKNTTIFHAGDLIHETGIVRSGSVNIENIDLWGNKSILSNIQPGQTFAETYALRREPMMVDAVAAENCKILFLDVNILMDSRHSGHTWYVKMLTNMLNISVQKNLTLSSRIFCTSSKTIRGRILTYLSILSVNSGSKMVTVPFDRQQLADYLNVDRSALSKELGKMRDEGIIEFHKRQFRLIFPSQ